MSDDRVKCGSSGQSRPVGGFPPIKICDEKDIIMQNQDTSVKREFSTSNSKGFSIKTILSQKLNLQNRYK